MDVAADVLANGHVFNLVHEPDDARQGVGTAPGVLCGAPAQERVEFPVRERLRCAVCGGQAGDMWRKAGDTEEGEKLCGKGLEDGFEAGFGETGRRTR